MSPLTHQRPRRGRRARWRPRPVPRATVALLAAALLIGTGLLGAPGIFGASSGQPAVRLVDDTTNGDNSGGNNSGNDSGGNTDNSSGGNTGNQDGGNAARQGGKTKTNANDSTDFPGRDKIGKAGPEQYVDFTGTGTGPNSAAGAGGTGSGGGATQGSAANSAEAGAAASEGASSSGSTSDSGTTGSAGTSDGSGAGDPTSAGTASDVGGGTGSTADSDTIGSERRWNGGRERGGQDPWRRQSGQEQRQQRQQRRRSIADQHQEQRQQRRWGSGGNTKSKNGGGSNNGGGGNGGSGAGTDNPGTTDLAAAENPEGGQFSAGSFSIRCSLSDHRNSDNPLLAPGKVNGAQHAHDYAGNNSANASSNTGTLEQSSTTCTNGDQSPVFWPVLRNLNGVGDDVGENGGSLDGNVGSIIEPTAIDLTFHGHGTQQVQPMPLTMVLNDGAAKSATEKGKGANAKYTCSGAGQLTDLYPLCPTGSSMQRVFDFPSCWNGRDTDSADHISHIVFPDPDGNCEANEVPVPALRLTLSYPPVQSRTFAIDSFPQEQHNPITDHALMEYLSTQRRAAAGASCINSGQRCTQGPESNPSAGNGASSNGSGVGFLGPQDRVPRSQHFTAALAGHAAGHDHYQVDLPGAPTLGRLLTAWQLDVLFTVLVGVLVLAYAAGLVLLRRRGRRWPWPRTAAWAAGSTIVLLATCSGWARYAEAMFSVHMAQHMTLLLVAPMLLALGAPVTLARGAAPAFAGRVGARLGRVPRVVLHPAAVLVGVLGADWGLYFSGLFSATLTYHWTHSLLDLAVLALGALFAYTVLGVDPAPTRRSLPVRLGVLLAAMPAHVGFALAVGNDPRLLSASFYRVLYLRWVPSVIGDQHTGGAVAAVVGELGLLLGLAALLAGAAAASGGALSGHYAALARRISTAGHRLAP